MIKRFLVLVLLCILAIPILVVPAAATSDHVTDTQFDMFVAALGNILDIINDNIGVVNDNMVAWFDSTFDLISSTQDQIAIKLTYIAERINYWLDIITGVLIEWFDKMNVNLTTQTTLLTNIRDRINYWLDVITSVLVEWFDKMNGNLKNINALTKDIRDRLIGWFSNLFTELGYIKTKLDNIFTGEQGAADDFNDQVSTEATEFEENMDIIQDVTRPTIEDIDLDIDKEIPDGEVVKVGQLLGIFFQNQYIYIIFFISFTFSLVSYGIFGKR